MFSPKLAAFIAANRPAPVEVLDFAAVQAAEKSLGREPLKNPDFKVWVEYPEYWGTSVNVQAGTVTYLPEAGIGGSTDERQSVAGILGFRPVVVDLPELAINLPAPAWVQATGVSDPFWLESTMCFRSELGELVAGFRDQLNDLIGGGRQDAG